MKFISTFVLSLALSGSAIDAFNVNCNSNLVLYWGQNSYGATHGNDGNAQKPLKYYCDQPGVSLVNLSFMHVFNGKNTPLINLSSACETTFPGTDLLTCPAIGADIKYCQSKGVAVLMSLGGAAGSYGFGSDADGKNFARQIWDSLFKGTTTNRPFGDAVLDGVDLDIEGGSSTGYTAFINELRGLYASDPSKKYYIAAAPQCPFPDGYLGPVLNSAWFDMVFIQFYNNYCGLNAQFNYADWDNWAKNTAVNKNVKLYVGLPGGQTGANNGYVDAGTISSKVSQVRSQYPNFGGLMFWDASQVYNNGSFGQSVASFLAQGTCGGTVPTSTSTPPVTSTTASTTKPPVTSTATSTSNPPVTSTTTSATTTTTTSVPGTCPINGNSCSNEGYYSCNGNSYALCYNGKWLLRQCASGTTCKYNGSSAVYCDFGNNNSCSVTRGINPIVPHGPHVDGI
ncbi:glycoside hydrolase [Neoconidiobolus thromboides FSU 785]|nr:glycoside hydrolase [Neoconidiobolus thromboides FSU 785]